MKKTLLLFGFVLLTSAFSIAQSPVTMGSILIDPYIGFPTSNVIWDNGTELNYKLNGGHLSYGARAEYMIAGDIGIGFDVNYVRCGYNYDANDTTYTWNQASGQYDTTLSMNNYDYLAQRTRIMVRLNKHFVQTDQVDAYIGVGAGYKLTKRDWKTNGEATLEQEEALIPIACRIAIGARFYFTQNIGAHIELGAFGGGIIQAGVAVKL